jgi:hypothetical protein
MSHGAGASARSAQALSPVARSGQAHHLVERLVELELLIEREAAGAGAYARSAQAHRRDRVCA